MGKDVKKDSKDHNGSKDSSRKSSILSFGRKSSKAGSSPTIDALKININENQIHALNIGLTSNRVRVSFVEKDPLVAGPYLLIDISTRNAKNKKILENFKAVLSDLGFDVREPKNENDMVKILLDEKSIKLVLEKRSHGKIEDLKVKQVLLKLVKAKLKDYSTLVVKESVKDWSSLTSNERTSDNREYNEETTKVALDAMKSTADKELRDIKRKSIIGLSSAQSMQNLSISDGSSFYENMDERKRDESGETKRSVSGLNLSRDIGNGNNSSNQKINKEDLKFQFSFLESMIAWLISLVLKIFGKQKKFNKANENIADLNGFKKGMGDNPGLCERISFNNLVDHIDSKSR